MHIKVFFSIILFIFGCAGFLQVREPFSSWSVRAPLFCHWGSWALEHKLLWCTGPVAPSGMWDLPRPGIELCLLHWHTTEPPGKALRIKVLHRGLILLILQRLCVSQTKIDFFSGEGNGHALRYRVRFSAAQTSHLGNTCQVFLP